jgi:large subunit ribosomal protein L15e
MANGVYHYIKQAWKKPSAEHKEEVRKNMIAWREGERVAKLEKPSRLDRARALGYKAKKGILVFRVTLERGGRQKIRPTTKRRSKRFNTKKILKSSYQSVAEQRVQKAHPNLEILNSYKLGKDGKFYFFEVITVDKNVAEIKSDPQFKWLRSASNRFRALRGLTSSGAKSRGFMNKNPNLKIRPSARAWDRKGR